MMVNSLGNTALDRFKDEFQKPYLDWKFGDRKADRFETACNKSQDTYLSTYAYNFQCDMNIEQEVVWLFNRLGVAKCWILVHGIPRTHGPISDFSSSRLASWANDDIINHAVAIGVMRKFEPAK